VPAWSNPSVAGGAVAKADALGVQIEVANVKLTLIRTNNMVRIAQGNRNTSIRLPVEMKLEIEARAEEFILQNLNRTRKQQ
jgi:hypothetical protein